MGFHARTLSSSVCSTIIETHSRSNHDDFVLPTPEIELYVSYSFDVHAGAMFAQTETIMFPGDDILNDMEKMNVELVLESDSDLVTIVDGYGTANVIVVDDDSKSTTCECCACV